MSETVTSVDVRTLVREDDEQVRALLTAAMAGGPTGERTPEFFDWKHRQNPFGESPGMVAVHGDRIVGVRLFLRWRLRSQAGVLHAVRAVDTATHPDFLRRGIFKRLTLELLDRLDREENLDLVFNTPNADSRPGYLRMGWQDVATLPVRIAPVRPVRFARGMRAASKANAAGGASAVAPTADAHAPVPSSLPRAVEAFTDSTQLHALVEAQGPSDRLRTDLSVDYLRWRYAAAPGLDYRVVRAERGGELVGVGFGRMRRRAGLVELTLGDVLTRPGDVRAAAAVLRAARRGGADHVSTHAAAGTEVARAALRSGYLQVPGNGIRLVSNPRTPAAAVSTDPAAWRLSLGDLEVF